MPFGAPYRTAIAAAIAGSDKFIFVISPDSLDSGPCADELAEAEAASKHIISVLRRPAREDQLIPEAVAERNWIFFEDDVEFDSSFAQLLQALDADLDWARKHTRLQVRARDWAAGGSDRSELLRGKDLRDAEGWLADSDAHPATPPITDQRQFIAASRRAADRATRLQRAVLAAGLVIALVLASLALVQTHRADLERDQAIAARDLAASDALAALSQATGDTDPAMARLEAVAGWRVQHTPRARYAMLNAALLPWAAVLSSADGTQVSAVAFSARGEFLAVATSGGTIQLCDLARRTACQRLPGTTERVESVAQLRVGGRQPRRQAPGGWHSRHQRQW